MSQLFMDDGLPANGKQKILLATSVYQDPAAAYTYSLQKSRLELHKAGINSAYILLSGNCHVDDARNSIVQEFLCTDCTDLVFLDADVVWEPKELIKLIKMENVDIVGGVYPYRRENDQNSESMPVLMYQDKEEMDDQGLIDVVGLPTGFMRIRREVLETLAAESQQYEKRGDHRMKIPIIFERTYIGGVRLGGDLNFCRKWKLKGGKIQAAAELKLGHVAQSILRDSLAAGIRRKNKATLKHLVQAVQNGLGLDEISEARKYLKNPWGAMDDVLSMCSALAKRADGDILETGTGLTSIVLAAATKHHVYCLEHDLEWVEKAKQLIEEAGVTNITIIHAPITQGHGLRENLDGYYDIPQWVQDKQWGLALNDGPPRMLGSRMGFFKYIKADTIICDDADDTGYASAIKKWAGDNYSVDIVERAALLRKKSC